MPNTKPILLVKNIKKRESSNEALLSNIQAAKNLGFILHSTLGPNAMMKMVICKMGVAITNDGNAVVRDLDIKHPAAKFIYELSRTQDETVGDGTTSVIILACELLARAIPLIKDEDVHPNEVIAGYSKFLGLALASMDKQTRRCDARAAVLKEDSLLMQTLKTALGSKLIKGNVPQVVRLVFEALKCVDLDDSARALRVQSIASGSVEDSELVKGVVLMKSLVSPHRMRSRIDKPKVMLVDGALEYSKAESQTEIELRGREGFQDMLRAEEDYVKTICARMVALGVDLVFVTGGVSRLAAHYLAEAGVSCLRNCKRVELDRLALSTGARIVSNDPAEFAPAVLGTRCGRFETKYLADDTYSFVGDCEQTKSCTLLLRGNCRAVVKEVETNVYDAVGVVKSLMRDDRVVRGGGGVEAGVHRDVSSALNLFGNTAGGSGANNDDVDAGGACGPVRRKVMAAACEALLVVPKILAENAGEQFHALRDRMLRDGLVIDGVVGTLVNCEPAGIWDSLLVKQSVLKTAFNAAVMLLRVDDVLTGLSKAPTD